MPQTQGVANVELQSNLEDRFGVARSVAPTSAG
jgi:hypothetical protein